MVDFSAVDNYSEREWGFGRHRQSVSDRSHPCEGMGDVSTPISPLRRYRQAEALRSVDCADRMPWARHEVIIDHADCLHECVAHRWARPLEPHRLEFLGHRVTFWRSRRNI
jgi:hypothetical protein